MLYNVREMFIPNLKTVTMHRQSATLSSASTKLQRVESGAVPGLLLATAGPALAADVDTPPAADAAAGDNDDDVVVAVVVVVARQIRSDEIAAVGAAACRQPVTAAGNDAVLPEFTDVRERGPTADSGVVAAETSANISESTLAEISPQEDGGTLAVDRGPVIRHAQHTIPLKLFSS